MFPLPMEAYQAADVAASRADAIEKAAPYIITTTLRFAAGRKQSVLTYLSRHLMNLWMLGALLCVWLQPGVDSNSRWLLATIAFGIVTRSVVEELLIKRLLRRSVLFAAKKPDYWR